MLFKELKTTAKKKVRKNDMIAIQGEINNKLEVIVENIEEI